MSRSHPFLSPSLVYLLALLKAQTFPFLDQGSVLHAAIYTMVSPNPLGPLVSGPRTRCHTDTLSSRNPPRRQDPIHERMVSELKHVRPPIKFLAAFLGLRSGMSSIFMC